MKTKRVKNYGTNEEVSEERKLEDGKKKNGSIWFITHGRWHG